MRKTLDTTRQARISCAGGLHFRQGATARGYREDGTGHAAASGKDIHDGTSDANADGRRCLDNTLCMPSKYGIDTLPAPQNADIRLVAVPSRLGAAIRFSGVATDNRIVAKQAELQAWMNKQGIEAKGEPIYAYYNDPFTPSFLRRNEVLFDVIRPSNDLERATRS